MVDTEKLQALLVILRAAGATRFKWSDQFGEYELQFPPPAPGPQVVAPRTVAAGTPAGPAVSFGDYDRLFGGQKPSFGGE